MPKSLKDILSSGPVQLNIIGVLLVILLGLLAWHEAQPLTWVSILPLAFIAFALWRIIFELTINRANVPTLATSLVGRRKITEILHYEASLRDDKSYTIIDLGSGRGQLTRRLAKAIPKAKVIGVEIARLPCMQAAFVQRWFGPKNLSYKCADFWTINCADIDAVYFFLTPTLAQKIGEKLDNELKPGSIVISHTFPLLGKWTPVKVLNFCSPFKETIYVYRKA